MTDTPWTDVLAADELPTDDVIGVLVAGRDIALDITHFDRADVTLGAASAVSIARLSAGDDLDVVINDSREGNAQQSAAGVRVNLYDPPSDVQLPGSGNYVRHFRPDEGAADYANVLRALDGFVARPAVIRGLNIPS